MAKTADSLESVLHCRRRAEAPLEHKCTNKNVKQVYEELYYVDVLLQDVLYIRSSVTNG